MPSMTPERWERVHDVLQEALERDPPTRRRFLRDIGRREPAVRVEVDSLLAACAGQGRFDRLVERFIGVRETEAALPGRIGAYRPVRRLGGGGMGAVYLAERVDGAFDQRVALKLLPAGTGADLHSRFLAERQILSRLRHPNIARLLDGGTTVDGLPYLVLEYVEGESVTEYCDRRALGVEARLRLFLEVCAAVSYAHVNLVVHRDLKPGNVLAAGGDDPADPPRVKLLDFGIAKLLDPSDGSSVAPATRTGFRPMTPEYAAPEQIRGEAVTTATDVYQLGALAYELLCGRRPHQARSRQLRDLERAVCESEPPRPSAVLEPRPPAEAEDDVGVDPEAIARARAATPQRLRRRLAGDLDTIVLRALSKDPDRRYASADALAADVRRHLAGLPVHARPDTWAYRARAFVDRNRAATVVAAGVAVVLALSAAALAVQNRSLADAKDRAERSVDFLVAQFGDLEPARARGPLAPARDLLDRARDRARIDLAGRPLVQARIFDGLGATYQMRGHYAEAEPLLREAVALRLARLDEDAPEVAESRHALANLLLETGRPAEAEPLLEAAAAAYRSRFGPDDPRVAYVQIDQALARRAVGDAPAAEPILVGVVDLLRKDPEGSRADLATALLYLGKLRTERGDTGDAEGPLREALDLRRARYGDDHPTVPNALDGLGELLVARGDYGSAEDAFAEALSIRRRIFPGDHPDVGVGLHNLGIALLRQGRTAEAAGRFEEALAILRATYVADHPDVSAAKAYLDSTRVVGSR